MPTPAKRGRPPGANPPDTSIHIRCPKKARGLIKLAAEGYGMDMTAYLLHLAWQDMCGGRSVMFGDEVTWTELGPKNRLAKVKRLRELVGMRLLEEQQDPDPNGAAVYLTWRKPATLDLRPF